MEKSTMDKTRKNFSPEEKILALKQHLLEKTEISRICESKNMQPCLFYRWQKVLFEKGAMVFADNTNVEIKKLKEENQRLNNILVKKNEVLLELMEDHIRLKKNLGEH